MARPRWTVIATYIPTALPAMRAIATRSSPMIPLVMSDGVEPVPTTSGFAIPRRGRSGDVAATRASGRGACGAIRAFRDEGAAPRASYCARIMFGYLKAEAAPTSAHGDSPWEGVWVKAWGRVGGRVGCQR